MSGSFPTSPGPATVRLDSIQPVIEDISESGKRQSRISSGHLWGIKMAWQQLLRVQMASIYAFLAGQRGDSFQIVLPNHNAPQGTVTGSININGIAEAGSMSIYVEGFTAGTSDVFKAGDIFKADNHSKVYMVADDADAGANSDLLLEDGVSFLLLETGDHLLLESSGQATLNLITPIIEEITDGINITYSDVAFTVAHKDEVLPWKSTAPNISTYDINLTESIS